MEPGLQARMSAAKLLAAVVDRKTSLDGLLDLKGGNPAFLLLSENDRNLVRAVLHSALRHRIAISHIFETYLSNELPAGARTLLHVLHVAAAQILYLDVPNRAAIDLAVETA